MPPSKTRKNAAKKTAAKKTTSRARRTTEDAQNAASPGTPDMSQPIPSEPDPSSKYAATSWASGGVGTVSDLQVPSGQLCLVRRPGVQGLMTAGVLHNVDSLSALVDKKHLKKGPKGSSKEINLGSLMKDAKGLEQMMHTVDRVVTYCVLQPQIVMTPNDKTRRKDGVIYADMVDLMDKMHIFNYVLGGVREVEPFREQLDAAMASVDPG